MSIHKAAVIAAVQQADHATRLLRSSIFEAAEAQVAKATEARAALEAALDALAEVK